MKNFILCPWLVIVFLTVTLFACYSKRNDKIYSAGITGNTGEKISGVDLKFLVNAYSIGLFKLNLANEARIRSTSVESVQLAKVILDFNSNINHQIERISSKHDIALPMDLTDEQKVLWRKLIKEKGRNFDQAFADIVDKIESAERALYQHASQASKDTGIKHLKQKIEPELQLHQTLIETLINKINEKIFADANIKMKSKSSNKLQT